MSIRNYNDIIYVIDLNTGDILEVVHDYYKYRKEIEKEMLFDRLEEKLKEHKEIAIKYGKEV